MSQTIRRTCLVFAAAVVLAASPALCDSPTVQTIGGIEYLNGGVGLNERATMRSDFPLKLIFARTDTAFVNSVDVTIFDQFGKVVFDLLADNGPWLYVNLPAGFYRVRAEYQEIARESTVRIDGPGDQEELTLLW